MAVEIYQTNPGYLWVEDREIPLFDTQWIHSTNMGYDYITIKNSSYTAIQNAPLRHIVDQNGNGYANLEAWTNWWNSLSTNNAIPYSSYTAFLTQVGTAAPSAVILEDTITGAVWARASAGTYTLTKAGAFIDGKTVPNNPVSYYDNSENKYTLTRTSANVLTLTTYAAADTSTPADGILSSQYVHIEIYN